MEMRRMTLSAVLRHGSVTVAATGLARVVAALP
jgi:hypothetical protein